MTRLAAIVLLGLAATPAAAGCRTVPETVASFRPLVPAGAYVGEVPAAVLPTVLAWLESEGAPHAADQIIQVAGDRGLALVLVTAGQVCDGVAMVKLIGDKATELTTLVRRYREIRGLGPERAA